MGKYALATTVSTEKSRMEIERTLARYGATDFAYGWENGGQRAVIMFRMHGRMIRFILEMPDPQSNEFTMTPTRGRERSPEDARKLWEQACRQRWRAMALVIKAKLEAIESGIVVFEDEFLAQTVLPNNQTVADWMRPQVEAAYQKGRMPKLLSYAGDDAHGPNA